MADIAPAPFNRAEVERLIARVDSGLAYDELAPYAQALRDALKEIDRLQHAVTADEARVWSVVERVAAAVLGPNGPTCNDWSSSAAAIASRAAKQLATASNWTEAQLTEQRDALLARCRALDAEVARLTADSAEWDAASDTLNKAVAQLGDTIDGLRATMRAAIRQLARKAGA